MGHVNWWVGRSVGGNMGRWVGEDVRRKEVGRWTGRRGEWGGEWVGEVGSEGGRLVGGEVGGGWVDG